MDFTFRCTRVADTYFKDLGITVSSGDKFDFYEDGELTGTLIDGAPHTIGTFRNSPPYFAAKKKFWNNIWDFSLHDDTGTLFAKSDIERKNSQVRFPAYNTAYHLRMGSNHLNESDYSRIAEFHINYDVYCVINYYPFVKADNWWKRNFSNSPFEGTIALADGLSREHLLGFVLLLNRQMLRDSD